MSIRKAYEELSSGAPLMSETYIRDTPLYKDLEKKLNSSKERLVLSALVLSFTKIVLVDRHLTKDELSVLRKSLDSFIHWPANEIDMLIAIALDFHRSVQGRKSHFIAAPFVVLQNNAAKRTMQRICDCFLGLVMADGEKDEEELYLLKLISSHYGIDLEHIDQQILEARARQQISDSFTKTVQVDEEAPAKETGLAQKKVIRFSIE